MTMGEVGARPCERMRGRTCTEAIAAPVTSAAQSSTVKLFEVDSVPLNEQSPAIGRTFAENGRIGNSAYRISRNRCILY